MVDTFVLMSCLCSRLPIIDAEFHPRDNMMAACVFNAPGAAFLLTTQPQGLRSRHTRVCVCHCVCVSVCLCCVCVCVCMCVLCVCLCLCLCRTLSQANTGSKAWNGLQPTSLIFCKPSTVTTATDMAIAVSSHHQGSHPQRRSARCCPPPMSATCSRHWRGWWLLLLLLHVHVLGKICKHSQTHTHTQTQTQIHTQTHTDTHTDTDTQEEKRQ